MSFTRSRIRFCAIVVALFSVTGSAQDFVYGVLTKEDCVPLELEFESAAEVIKTVQGKESFPAIQNTDFHIGMKTFEKYRAAQLDLHIPVIDEESEGVKLVRAAFDRTQKFLFGEKKPFKLVLCERCDLQPNIINDLTIYVDIRFIEELIQKQDKNLVNLDLAHAFSHYVLEMYLADAAKSPGGHFSRYLSWLYESFKGPKLTPDEKVMLDARYHAEVDALAAAILIMTGQQVPDFSPVVDMYRINRLRHPRGPFTPYEIYVDQEVRVNTLKWIIKKWPKAHRSDIS